VLEAGFDGYISKPFNVATLGDELIACLAAFEQKHATTTKQQTV
jgi:DNA-binding response OmpR family regulator